MKLIFGSDSIPDGMKGLRIALGNFDGVHLGHQKIIRASIESTAPGGTGSAVYTFAPHPVSILASEECPQLIQTLDQKLKSIEEMGVDACIIERFDEKFAGMNPEKFFKEIIIDRLSASEIIVGYDFTFGRHRSGTTKTLQTLANDLGIGIKIIEAQLDGETLISSTNIRRLIERGRMEAAAKLLGRLYSVEGEVVTGRGVGRSLGARTANIEPINELMPRHGVYVSRTRVIDSPSIYPSITSIGDNPTFRNAGFTFETHIIDREIDLIGKRLRVELISRLRDQLEFKSSDELREQIHADISTARKHGELR